MRGRIVASRGDGHAADGVEGGNATGATRGAEATGASGLRPLGGLGDDRRGRPRAGEVVAGHLRSFRHLCRSVARRSGKDGDPARAVRRRDPLSASHARRDGREGYESRYRVCRERRGRDPQIVGRQEYCRLLHSPRQRIGRVHAADRRHRRHAADRAVPRICASLPARQLCRRLSRLVFRRLCRVRLDRRLREDLCAGRRRGAAPGVQPPGGQAAARRNAVRDRPADDQRPARLDVCARLAADALHHVRCGAGQATGQLSECAEQRHAQHRGGDRGVRRPARARQGTERLSPPVADSGVADPL